LAVPDVTGGHGGGDFGVLRAFLAAMGGDRTAITDIEQIGESHLLALAAEYSRSTDHPVDMAQFRAGN
jgi:hypothetical protein